MEHKRISMQYRPFQCVISHAPYWVVTTNDPALQAELYRQTNQDALLSLRQTVAGIAQHPDTGLYQTWISTNGFDVTSISAHLRAERAEQDLQAVKSILGSQDYYDANRIEALLVKLSEESNSQPQPFPNELVRGITQDILRMVTERSNHKI